MAVKFKDRYLTYGDVRLQRRISLSLGGVVDRMDSASSDDRKIVHLQKLLQVDLTEILPDQLKTKLFTIIQHDLNNLNSDIFELSFNLHMKLMKSIPSEYSTLCLKNAVHTLIWLTQLQQGKLTPDADDPVVSRLLYLSKYTLQIFNFVNNDIAPYSDEVLIEMNNQFVALLCKQTKDGNGLTPFDIISNIDYLSKWSKKIVRSQRSRTIFLNCLKNHQEFIKILLINIKDWCQSPVIANIADDITLHALDKETIKFHNFICCLCTIVNICKYQSSIQLFPVVVDDKYLDITFVLKVSFEFFKQSKYIHSLPQTVVTFIAKVLGTIFNNSFCLDRALLEYMFQDIHLWVSPLIILLSAITKHETTAVYFLEELEKLSIAYSKPNKTDNNADSAKPYLAKSVCKLIAYATNNIMRDEEWDSNLAKNLLFIFDNVFSKNHICHILIQEEPKLVPHLLHYCQNPRLIGEINKEQQIVILRCLQRVFTVVAFSPQCLLLLEEESSVQEMLCFADFQTVKNESWRFTFFLLTTILKKSEVYTSERKFIIKKMLYSFIHLLEAEAILESEEEEELICLIFAFTHDLQGLMSVLEVSDTESEVTVTETIEEFPLHMTEFLNIAFEPGGLESSLQLTALKLLRNMVNSLDCSLYLQNQLNLMAKIEGTQQFFDYDTSNESYQIIDEIHKAVFIRNSENYCESTERHSGITDMLLFLEHSLATKLPNHWLEHLSNFVTSSSEIKLEGLVFEQLLLNIDKMNTSLPSHDNVKLEWKEAEDNELSSEDIIGIELTLRYGKSNRLIDSSSEYGNDLQMLLASIKKLLGLSEEEFMGFNWFVATVFLMNEGDMERTQHCTSLLLQLDIVNILWIKPNMSNENWAHFDYIVSKELPFLCFTLQNYGICCWVLCQKWTSECFWRILSWDEIKKLVIFVLLHPLNYLFYFYITFLKTSEQEIIEKVQNGNFLLILENIDYKLSDHILDFEVLDKQYNNTVEDIKESGSCR